jgi:hypothetical protein
LASKFYSKSVPLDEHLKNKLSTEISNAYFDNYTIQGLNEHKDEEIIDKLPEEKTSDQSPKKKKLANIKKKGRLLKLF